MTEQILAAGFGGQGIMSLGYILTYAGMHRHMHVSHFPSYGVEMRGGTANCTMIISEKPISSPIVAKPTTLFIFNEPSYNKYYTSAADNALIILNKSLITSEIEKKNYDVVDVHANDEALYLGDIRVANMIMLGVFMAKRQSLISLDDITFGIHKILGHKGDAAAKAALTAVEHGMKLFA